MPRDDAPASATIPPSAGGSAGRRALRAPPSPPLVPSLPSDTESSSGPLPFRPKKRSRTTHIISPSQIVSRVAPPDLSTVPFVKKRRAPRSRSATTPDGASTDAGYAGSQSSGYSPPPRAMSRFPVLHNREPHWEMDPFYPEEEDDFWDDHPPGQADAAAEGAEDVVGDQGDGDADGDGEGEMWTAPDLVAQYYDSVCAQDALQRVDAEVFTLADRLGGVRYEQDGYELNLGVYVHLDVYLELPRREKVTVTCSCETFARLNTPPYLGTQNSAIPSPTFPMAASKCIHHCLVMRHAEELLVMEIAESVPDAPDSPPSALPTVIVFQDSRAHPAMVISLPCRSAGKRTFVSFSKNADVANCARKSCKFECEHVLAARIARQSNIEEYGLSDDDVRKERSLVELKAREDRRRGIADPAERLNLGGSSQRLNSISWKPIPPPTAFELPSDEIKYPPRAPIQPQSYPLARDARCSCGSSHRRPGFQPEWRQMKLFCTERATLIVVAMVRCATCKKRWIVSDLGEYEIFVWSGEYAFTHQLLNKYSCDYVFSETPFNSFFESQAAHYKGCRSSIDFCSNVTFMRAWFAFVSLQHVETKLQCPICKKTPNTVVCDGTASCICKKHILPSLRPVNHTDPDISPRSQLPTMQVFDVDRSLIPYAGYRAQIDALLDLDRDTLLAKTEHARWSFAVGMLVHPTLFQLMPLFAIFFLPQLPKRLVVLLKRLLRQISHPDLGLALSNPESWAALIDLSEHGHQHTSLRKDLLSFHAVLSSSIHAGITSTICRVPTTDTRLEFEEVTVQRALQAAAGWLSERGNEVFVGIAAGRLESEYQPIPDLDQGDWRETGCYYSLPQVRHRPIYDNLPDDQGKRRKGEGDAQIAEDKRCTKYYNTYTKCRQNGGIFAIWCPHAICYGFHLIRNGEGRDDLFSALYTRFEKAPATVIYDFACAAGAYCWRREPLFFRNTRFYIDELHQYNHKSCTTAFFASNAMRTNEELRRNVNTSAAEHGNSKLTRIRKSVSFMGQRHSIIYTAIFIHLHNRRKMLDQLKVKD